MNVIRVRLWFPMIHRMIYSSDLEFKENFIYDSINERFIYKDRNELIEQILNNQPFKADLKSYQMLWTGKKDKNGIDIYEKDIVINSLGRIAKVEWFESPSNLCWDLKPLNIEGKVCEWNLWNDLTIIGHDFDNMNYSYVKYDSIFFLIR